MNGRNFCACRPPISRFYPLCCCSSALFAPNPYPHCHRARFLHWSRLAKVPPRAISACKRRRLSGQQITSGDADRCAALSSDGWRFTFSVTPAGNRPTTHLPTLWNMADERERVIGWVMGC